MIDLQISWLKTQ